MKFFIDTANVEEIREAASLGILDGVTTNPSLVAKEGKDFHQVLRDIVSIVNGRRPCVRAYSWMVTRGETAASLDR